MLIILTFVLVIISAWMAFAKRTKENGFLFGLCVSLMFEVCGVMIYIAKKGGVSSELIPLFYFSKEVKKWVQYLMITLNQLGCLIALGRTLYPLFLIKLAMSYSMVSWIRRNKWLPRLTLVFPVVTLLLYVPEIYRMLTFYHSKISIVLNTCTVVWMTAYIIIAIYLVLYEYFAVSIKVTKRQLSHIVVCLLSLTGIYIMFYDQDPGQIYHFYSYSFRWANDATYMQMNAPLSSYLLMIGVCSVCCVLGFGSLYRFTRIHYETNKENIVMERKFDTAKVGASTFVHSMKNQLLASRVIYKRVGQLYEQPELDTRRLKEYVDTLEDMNEVMLTRMEELYRCVKSNAIYMIPTSMTEILNDTVQRFHKKYPNAEVTVEQGSDIWILSDKVHMCEAIYNLLINAQEAVERLEDDREGKVAVVCYNERQYTVIEVRDNGTGIGKSQIKKIFDPFYTSKNSNSNWGMGLYYVREIVKSHMGLLQVESRAGEGSTFYILLPKYEGR